MIADERLARAMGREAPGPFYAGPFHLGSGREMHDAAHTTAACRLWANTPQRAVDHNGNSGEPGEGANLSAVGGL